MQQIEQVEEQLSRYRHHWAVSIARNYMDDDADGLASIIAFAAMFSLMPILIVTFMGVTLVLQLQRAQDALPGVIADDVPPFIAERAEAVVQAGADNVASLGIAALVAFLLGGSKLYSAIDRACATIFRAERQRYGKRRLFALLMMPLIPALLLVATTLSAITTAALLLPIQRVTEVDPSNESLLVSYTSAFLLAFGLMLAAYWWIPQSAPGFRHAAEGASVAAGLMVLLAQFFPLYVKLASGYSVYGSLFSFVLMLMLWLYLVGQVFVIGAEVSAYRAGRRPVPR